MHGLVSPYECERRDGVAPVSWANQAAAFASISRSSRNTLISRRSRLSSSRSVVLKPSLRSPSSSPACLIHWRIVSTVGSNSPASAVMLRPPRANSTIRRRYSAAYGGCVRGIWKTPFPYPQHPLRNWVNFSDIGRPHLPDPLDLKPAQKVRIDPMLWCRLAGTRALVDGRQSHPQHQALHPLAIHRMALGLIEFRIIYLQRKQSRLLPEGHHQGGALAHPLERATRMDAQLGEGARAEVG